MSNLCPRARCVLLSVAARRPWIVGGRQFAFDPAFVIFVIGGYYNGSLVLSSVISPGLWSNRCNFSRLRFGGMSSHPLDRTVLIVVRVPLTIGFDDDVLHCVRCRVQDIAEVPVRQSVYTRRKRESFNQPIKYQLFWFQHLLADWAEPRCRLLHHTVPRRCIKTLRMNTFL